MNAATLMILLSMRDEATPKLQSFGATIQANRVAIRQMAYGFNMLGASILSMGIAMSSSNNEFAKTTGQTFMFVGSILTAIGSALQFVVALSAIQKQLQNVALWQAIVKAFEGPIGWTQLAIGAGIVGGITAGTFAAVNRNNAADKKIEVNIHNAGSMVTDKQNADQVRKAIAIAAQRNYTSGIK